MSANPYNAVYNRKCCVALIVGVVVDTTASRCGTIQSNSAVKDRQCRAASRTVVVNAATEPKGAAVQQDAAVNGQYGVIV